LLGPKTAESRPITDRVKESLFSVLYKYDLPDGKIVADLFCGVGSLGLEALSRGAEFVTFVEKDPKIIAILEKNIEKAGFASESKVIRANAFKIGAPVVLGTPYGDKQEYDLIFVDPPYSTTRQTKQGSPLSELLVLLSGQSALNGVVVVRTDRRTPLETRRKKSLTGRTELLDAPLLASGKRQGGFQTIERRRWATMVVTILQRRSK